MKAIQKYTIKTLIFGLSLSASLILAISIYLIGFVNGKNGGLSENLSNLINNQEISSKTEEDVQTPKPTVKATNKPVAQTQIAWGGPQLWAEVNKRRVEFGVSGLSQKDELCTIASIRLNQLLDKGDLDGHEGFSKLPEERPDLKWIFDKYNLSEFLVAGATSAKNAVELWENSLGHKKLLSGGEYVWGYHLRYKRFPRSIHDVTSYILW